MKAKQTKRKISSVFLSFLLSVGLFVFLSLFAWFLSALNISTQSYFQNIKSKIFGYTANPRVMVVEIDNATLRELWFPFDRSYYGNVVKNLSEAWSDAVWLDIIFEDPSNTSSDTKFAQAIQDAGNVLIGFARSPDGIPLRPLSIFSDNSVATGYFNIDSGNTVLDVELGTKLRDKKYYDYFPLAVLKSADGYSDYLSHVDGENYQLSPLYSFPTSARDSRALISFIPQKNFTRVSFLDVYKDESFAILKQKIDFKNSIILLGMTADGTKDTFLTPNGKDYGVYVHANMINTVLQGYHSSYFNTFIEKILLFLLLFLGCYFNISGRWKKLIWSNIAVVTIFLFIVPLSVVLFTDLLLNYFGQFIIGLLWALIISNIAKYLWENKDKNKLNTALWEYVSKEVSSEILDGTWEVNLDGESKNIVMFFSDIEWFTSISEKFSPEKLVYFLREYLWEMSNIIMDNRGFINKYEWDAIMALWGAFWKNDNNVYNACFSALQQQKSLSILNEKWTKSWEFEPFQVRMWIHSWDAILWNIGATGRKLEFTALGDNVNLASRLEWINKYYNTYLCISQDVYDDVWDNFECRYLDNIRVKGKQEPIKIYELLSLKNEISSDSRKIIDNFSQALELYYGQDFVAAEKIFKKLSRLWDGPSKTYVQRCEDFMQNPPDSSWDKIWTFDSK